MRLPMPATAPPGVPISARPSPGRRGVVTAEAKAEFERALALDAGEVKASYFLGSPRNRTVVTPMPPQSADFARQGAGGCAVAPAGAGRVDARRRRGRAALPDSVVAAAKDMNENDRQTMIRAWSSGLPPA